jgi:hypothetical protein
VQLGLKGLHSLQTILVRKNRFGGEYLEDQVLLVLPLPLATLLLTLLLLNLHAI